MTEGLGREADLRLRAEDRRRVHRRHLRARRARARRDARRRRRRRGRHRQRPHHPRRPAAPAQRRAARLARGARRGVPAQGRLRAHQRRSSAPPASRCSRTRATRRAGLLRQKDPTITAARPLDIFFHGLVRIDGKRARVATGRRSPTCATSACARTPSRETCATLDDVRAYVRRHGGAPPRARARDRRRRHQGRRCADARRARRDLEVPALGDRLQVPGRGADDDAAATSRSASAAPAP